MTIALFTNERDAIEVSTEKFQATCEQELQRAATVIASIVKEAPKDHPIWHDYPFGDVSFAHETSKRAARAQGVLRQIGSEKEGQEAAITSVLIQACMWLAWRKLQTVDIAANEPISEPESEPKAKRRLSLRRPS